MMLAAVLAFAFTQPMHVNNTVHAKINGVWTPIPGQQEGVDYDCNSLDDECTAVFENDDPENGEMTLLNPGVYTPRP